MGMMGNLRQNKLTDMLRLIGDGLRRGRLVMERGGLRADLYCENGYLTHVWRSGPVTSLAQQWLATGLIAPPALNQIATMTGADPLRMPDQQFAQFATEQGFVAPDLLMEWARQDAIALLNILLSWSDGDFRFEEGMVPPPGRIRVPLPIPDVLGTLIAPPTAWPTHPPPRPVTSGDVLDYMETDPALPTPIRVTREEWHVLMYLDGLSPLIAIAAKLTESTGVTQQHDPQRFEVERRRFEALVTRVGGDLVARGLCLVMKTIAEE